jgi:hypothetical protein
MADEGGIEVFEKILNILKQGAKLLKDAGFNHEEVKETVKKKLAELVEKAIDFKIDFLEYLLERIIIIAINIAIDKFVDEIFEDEEKAAALEPDTPEADIAKAIFIE